MAKSLATLPTSLFQKKQPILEQTEEKGTKEASFVEMHPTTARRHATRQERRAATRAVVHLLRGLACVRTRKRNKRIVETAQKDTRVLLEGIEQSK